MSAPLARLLRGAQARWNGTAGPLAAALAHERRPRAEIEAHAARKLSALVAHAALRVPFWRERFARAGIDPARVRTIDDLATLPPLTPQSKLVLDPPAATGTPAQTAEGATLYNNSCGVCHGDAAVAGTLVTDLRTSPALNSPDLWQQIVHDGVMKDRGMVAWSKNFTPAQIENIRLYVIKRANEDKALEAAASAKNAAN